MVYIKLSLPLSGKELMWDDTTHVDISTPDVKCSILLTECNLEHGFSSG